MKGRRAALVVVLVVLAGCIGVSNPPRSNASTETVTTPDRESWTGHPWRGATLTVGVENSNASDGEFVRLVRNATGYWDQHVDEYAGYRATFVVEPNASDPDVRVVYADGRSPCGDANDPVLGCAPVIDRSGEPPRTVHVEITPGYSDATTRRVLKHELGHVLGLDHDDRPRSVMSATLNATHRQTMNATERSLPWRSRNVSVYVNTPRPGHRDQVEHALAYFEDGADGSLAVTPRFSVVDDPKAADVVVRVLTSPVLAVNLDEAGSIGNLYGEDPDDDGSLEYYTHATVTVAGVGDDASGWHVAYWLAYAMGYEKTGFPLPLADADRADRRSDWWRDGNATRPIGGRPVPDVQ